jgi:hypothetical protein
MQKKKNGFALGKKLLYNVQFFRISHGCGARIARYVHVERGWNTHVVFALSVFSDCSQREKKTPQFHRLIVRSEQFVTFTTTTCGNGTDIFFKRGQAPSHRRIMPCAPA